MTLLVDAATTGLTWATLNDGRMADVEVLTHRGIEPEAWHPSLTAHSPAPSRVLVANRAGASFEARFRAFSSRQWRVVPEFPAASAQRHGVSNGYARPAALGIDRWLAMLAAWRRARAPLVVATAGAAFAVDLIDGGGAHRGGCVVPGERLMREALHAQTSGIAAAALLDAAAIEGAFGINTAGAVQQGSRLVLAALVERAAQALEAASGSVPRIFITGEAARDIAPLVTRATELEPHLVLDGLALLASEPPS